MYREIEEKTLSHTSESIAAMTAPRLSSHFKTPQNLINRHTGWQLGLPLAATEIAAEAVPTILAVGGGKGGVGKSVLSANLSARLAMAGFRVLAMDMDLGCANLHTHFGVGMPDRTLADFVVSRRRAFKDVLLPTPIPGLALVAGGREEVWGDVLSGKTQSLSPLYEAIFTARQELGVDFVILDLGAGTHKHTIDFFATAHMGIVTVLPEPTSIENAYVFAKSLLWSVVEAVAERIDEREALPFVKEALAKVGPGSLQSGYAECLHRLSSTYPRLVNAIMTAMSGRALGLVLNQTRSQNDIDIGHAMEHICQRYFGFDASYLGYLTYDEAVWRSLRNRRPLVKDFPHSVLSKRIGNVAAKALLKIGYQGERGDGYVSYRTTR